MKTQWKKMMVAELLAGLAAETCLGAEMVLDRQGSWALVQAGEGTTQTLWLEREGSEDRACLASVEVPSATVTNSYWDAYAGLDEATGLLVGGMVERVDTVAADYRFQAFVNDGRVYWEDWADGKARLWTASCKSPEAKTLLAEGDAGKVWETSAFDTEPWNRGAAWREAGADRETMAVFANGATTRLSGEAAMVAKKEAGRKGVEEYETDYGYAYTGEWRPPYSGWQSEFQERQAVVIPDGVTRIGMGLFGGCTNLTSATIPDSVTEIGYAAFYQCTSLTNVTMGNGVTDIGGCAFSGCSSLTNLTIPDSVTDIGEFAFNGCTALASATIPDGVTSIPWFAFNGCSSLASVTIPDSVTDIGEFAFNGCSGLTSLSVPGSWYGTTKLRLSELPENCVVTYRGMEIGGTGNENVGGVEWEYYLSGGLAIVVGASPAEGELAIPAMLGGTLVGTIGNSAFSGCEALTSVTIPDSVTNIGRFVFYECYGLTSVRIGNGVTSIGNYVFGCSGLKSMTIPDSVTSIGQGVFSHCNSLKVLFVPAGWDAMTILRDANVPAGCAIVAYDSTGTVKTTGAPVGVPQAWLAKKAGRILAGTEGCCDFEAAAKAEAANGMAVWECYLAGLEPEDASAAFTVKSIEFVDGKVVVTWEPDLNEGETKKERSYVLEGAETLGAAWGTTNAESRFFRVRVEMP